MKQISFLFALIVACSSVPQDADYLSSQQGYNSNPPPRMICDYPMEACGAPRCVNLQWDNNNCGVCGNECERGVGEICHNFQCKSIENFGFDNDVITRGPAPYVPQKDLPRPSSMSGDVR